MRELYRSLTQQTRVGSVSVRGAYVEAAGPGFQFAVETHTKEGTVQLSHLLTVGHWPQGNFPSLGSLIWGLFGALLQGPARDSYLNTCRMRIAMESRKLTGNMHSRIEEN